MPTEQISEIVMAKGDSAASHHYWRIEDAKVLSNIIDKPGPSVVIPNNSTIAVTSQGDLPISEKLSPCARNAMILPGLKSASLVSIGQLCDDDCNVLLNKKKLIAVKDNEIVLQGVRNYSGNVIKPVKTQENRLSIFVNRSL